jgi:GNAT superfamily N-acetyltransferase
LNVTEFEGYRLRWTYGHACAARRAQLMAFWQAHGAVTDPYEAWRRTFEVACIAYDSAGQIAGVSSVYSAHYPVLGAPQWFYRSFIHPASRLNGLAQRMVSHTVAQLADAFAGEPGAPVGVIIVTENPKLETPAGQRQLQRLGFVHLGVNETGQSVWQRCFPT